MSRIKCAIIGSGNIGTDLMIKIRRLSTGLELAALVGIDPESDGLARARRLNVATTSDGVAGLIRMPEFPDIQLIFDASSAKAHLAAVKELAPYGKRFIDLTPAAVGPFVVPAVNLDQHLDAENINMVTCGGQATIPIVAAVSRVTDVAYAEIVATIASRSAGPGTRANIDEFTETTSRAVVTVGGARRGKAIIILNPAEPPMIMRDTVFCLIGPADHDRVRASIAAMVADVAAYVPGYRLKQDVQFTPIPADEPLDTLLAGAGPGAETGAGTRARGERPDTRVSVLLEVEGAAHYLPSYAGNLDIMTSAALRVGERLSVGLSEAAARAGAAR